jgi:hypothetical protein
VAPDIPVKYSGFNEQKGKAMNQKYLWLIVAVLVVGLVFTTMLATAQETEPTTRWEYNITYTPQGPTDHYHVEKTEAKVNELGEAGWELVGWEGRTWIFKRPAN